jgi:hypothetical protein
VADKLFQKADKQIYCTTNLRIFNFDTTNRPINMDRVKEIAREIIGGNNLLDKYPIIVNHNFDILDGQHRTKAAELAQVAIYYIIDETMTMEKAANAVKLTKGWSTKDWLHHWTQKKNSDYMALQSFMDEYEWMNISFATRLCSSNSYQSELFKNGLYRADRTGFARIVANMAIDFKPYFSKWDSSRFMQAVMQLAANPNYSHKRMLDKLKYQTNSLRPCATVDLYLENISDIYNNRMPEDKRTYFRAANKLTR